MISRDDVLAALARTRGCVRRTPLLPPAAGTGVWLKCEFLQHTGVFKTRGAFNRQLAALERGAASERPFGAVHSRHDPVFGQLFVSQYTGTCEPRY